MMLACERRNRPAYMYSIRVGLIVSTFTISVVTSAGECSDQSIKSNISMPAVQVSKGSEGSEIAGNTDLPEDAFYDSGQECEHR
jgi:hypothetical protein